MMNTSFAFSFLLPFFAFIFWMAIQFPFLRPVLTLGTLILFFMIGLKSTPAPPQNQGQPAPHARQAIPLHPPGNP